MNLFYVVGGRGSPNIRQIFHLRIFKSSQFQKAESVLIIQMFDTHFDLASVLVSFNLLKANVAMETDLLNGGYCGLK